MKVVLGGGVVSINGLPINLLPVGTIIETVDPTSPAELYGGEWELFGQGRVFVCADENDEDFKNALKEGGEKTHKLTVGEIPSHCHSLTYTMEKNSNYWKIFAATGLQSSEKKTDTQTGYTGGDGSHNNLQPYIVGYRWRYKGPIN